MLTQIHVPTPESHRRRTSHCRILTVAPTTVPNMANSTCGYNDVPSAPRTASPIASAAAPPKLRPVAVAHIHQPAWENIRRRTSHWKAPTTVPSTNPIIARPFAPPTAMPSGLPTVRPTPKPTALANVHKSQKRDPASINFATSVSEYSPVSAATVCPNLCLLLP